jgi:Ni/Co efflux regulator RcnB
VVRKFLFSLLLATALTPAVAQDRSDWSDNHSESRSERSTQRAERSNADRPARAERSSSADRPGRAERSSSADRPARAERAQRSERSADVDHTSRADRQPRGDRAANADRPDRAESGQRAKRPVRADRVQPAERDVEPVQAVQSPQPTQPAQSNESQLGGLAGAIVQSSRGDHADDDDRDHDHDWSKNWRKDRRYDWWNYRNRYRSLFRLGHYYDPYGWGYRRWSAGFSLWPSYYGSSFWLNDPWMYRLPPVYGPYRWVRYYDDALLVNIYTGQVIDVVYNVFW